MKNIIKIAIILIFLIRTLTASDIRLNIDDAVFWEGEDDYRWEFYYSFNEDDLRYIESEGSYLGELFIRVSLNSNIKLEHEQKWIVSHNQKDLEEGVSNQLIGQKNFILRAGQYKVNVYIQDVYDSTSFADISYDLIIPVKRSGKLALSSIEAAQQLAEVSDKRQNFNKTFIKHDYYAVPNPSLVFVNGLNALNSYLEIYNYNMVNYDGLKIEYSLSDVYGNSSVRSLKEIESESALMHDFYSLDLNKVASGTYYLRAGIYFEIDSKADSIFTEKKIFVLNREMKISDKNRFSENLSFDKSEFSTLTVEQTEIEIDKLKPIATSEELDIFEELETNEAKQRMIFRFWQNRSQDSSGAFNETLFKYRELIKFSDRFFSYGNTPGWKSDRGRILLRYGKPTQRDQYPFFGDKRPYEEWFFAEIQGGIYFYFVDMTGFGNFKLVHSTAINELRYDNWYNDYVLKNRDDPYNNNDGF